MWTLGSSGKLIALGRIAGLLLEFTILLQLLLIGRVPWIERIFGHDKLNRLHRLIGYSVSSLLITHPLLLIFGYAQINQFSLWRQFLDFWFHWEDAWKAAVALVIFLSIIFISIAVVRRKLRYETWHGIHLLMYVAIFLVFGHQINTADVSSGQPLYYWYVLNFSVFGLVLLYRWLRPLWLFYKHKFSVADIKRETLDVVSVYINGNDLGKYKFQAGQFANLTFLKKGMWFTHPFSFSKAPDGKTLRFSVKASGDFTNQVSSLPLGTKVIIDGPLGTFTAKSARANKFLLLAAGIGITPLRALAQELADEERDAILIYGNKTESDIAFKPELAKLNIKKYFLLSRQHLTNFEHGRLSHEKISRLVPDYKEREIYICGPDEMIKRTRDELLKSGVAKKQIHYERFAY